MNEDYNSVVNVLVVDNFVDVSLICKHYSEYKRVVHLSKFKLDLYTKSLDQVREEYGVEIHYVNNLTHFTTIDIFNLYTTQLQSNSNTSLFLDDVIDTRKSERFVLFDMMVDLYHDSVHVVKGTLQESYSDYFGAKNASIFHIFGTHNIETIYEMVEIDLSKYSSIQNRFVILLYNYNETIRDKLTDIYSPNLDRILEQFSVTNLFLDEESGTLT